MPTILFFLASLTLLRTFVCGQSLLPGYTYQNCYFIPLMEFRSHGNFMSLRACAITCSAYDYFGVRQGGSCYCATSISPLEDLAYPGACNTHPCTGKADELCGGTGMAVYKKDVGTQLPIPQSPTYHSIGCYTTAYGSDPLPAGITFPYNNLIIQKCEAICAGYKFFGLRNGDKCLCGDALRFLSLIDDPELCTYACNGDSTQNCGSTNRISIYASLPACGDFSPLRVMNPGFENGVARWVTNTNSPSISWQVTSVNGAQTGQRYARFISKDSSAEIKISQPTKICPGTGYVVSFWAKQPPNSGCQAKMFYQESEEFVAIPSGTGWEKFESFLVSYEEIGSMTIVVTCPDMSTIGKFYIDNVQLRRGLAADAADIISQFERRGFNTIGNTTQ